MRKRNRMVAFGLAAALALGSLTGIVANAESADGTASQVEQTGGENTQSQDGEAAAPVEKQHMDLEGMLGDTKITVSGDMPKEGTTAVTVHSADVDAAKEYINNDDFTAYATFDISMMHDGVAWQPVDDGTSVNITLPVAGIPDGNVAVYRALHDGSELTKLSGNASGGMVTFATNHFTEFTIGTETVDDTVTANWDIATTVTGKNLYAMYDVSKHQLYITIKTGVSDDVVTINSAEGRVADTVTAHGHSLADIQKIIVDGGANTISLSTAFFAGLSETKEIVLTSSVDIANGQQLFASCGKLEKVTFQKSPLVLPADLSYMFANDESLTEVSGFTNTDVTMQGGTTTANVSYMFSGCDSLTELNLSGLGNAATDQKHMIYGDTKLKKITFSDDFTPKDNSGWTGRWKLLDAANSTSKLASSIISSWVTGTAATYVKLTSDDEYAELNGDFYATEGLSVDNAYNVKDTANPFTSYCIQWVKDSASYYYTRKVASSDAAFAGYIDTDAELAALTPAQARNLTDYDNSVLKALRTALYFGFPNDADSIQAKYSLTDEQYRMVTQDVIWNMMSGRVPVSSSDYSTYTAGDGSAAANAYAALHAKKYSEINDPSSMTVYLYMPEEGTSQSMVSGLMSVKISKYEITGKKELPGATLTLTDSKGTSLGTWTSGTTPHVITGLEYGKKYTLTETAAPAGYTIAEAVSFTAGGHAQHVSMRDGYKTHKVTIHKKDENGAYVVGAGLKVTGTLLSGETYSKEFTSENNGQSLDLYPGSYTVTEVYVPDGYAKADDISFTVNPTDDTDKNYTMVDKQDIKVTVFKKDSEDSDAAWVKGAKLVVKDSAGNIVDSWTTEKKGHVVSGLTLGNTYTLTEKRAPAGYKKAADITFTASDSEKVFMVDEYKTHKVTVKKLDQDGNRVPGATIALTGTNIYGDDITATSFTTTEGGDNTISVIPGEYTLTETKVPDGYTVADPITFEVKATDGNFEFTMTDKKKAGKDDSKEVKLTVKKLDKDDTSKVVKDAKLAIYEGDTEIVRFTTSDSAFTTTACKSGKSYTLKELEAPEGYDKADDIAFTMPEKDHEIIMYDKKSGSDKEEAAVTDGETRENGTREAGTGDYTTSMAVRLVILFVALGLGVIGIFAAKKKKNK